MFSLKEIKGDHVRHLLHRRIRGEHQHLASMEMVFLKHHLTPLLWDDLTGTASWYDHDERWAEAAILQMEARGFSYSEENTSAGIIIHFSHERLADSAGAAKRPLAIARAIAAVLSHPKGFEIFTGKEGLTVLSASCI